MSTSFLPNLLLHATILYHVIFASIKMLTLIQLLMSPNFCWLENICIGVGFASVIRFDKRSCSLFNFSYRPTFVDWKTNVSEWASLLSFASIKELLLIQLLMSPNFWRLENACIGVGFKPKNLECDTGVKMVACNVHAFALRRYLKYVMLELLTIKVKSWLFILLLNL